MKIMKIDGNKSYNSFEITEDSIIEAINTEFIYSGFTINNELNVHIPYVKIIGSKEGFNRGHSFMNNLKTLTSQRLRMHAGIDISTTRIILLDNSTLKAPLLESLRDLTVNENCLVILPKVVNIFGSVTIKQGSNVYLPNLEIISGELIVENGGNLIASNLKEVRNLRLLTLEELLN